MQTITALVHTKNSAATLESCLASLSWCDQIWVIDMQSSDATLKIAKKYDARIFEEKSQLQFADPIRNKYMQKVQTDWTLIVDSDEEVGEKLAQKIKEAMLRTDVNGFLISRQNIIFGHKFAHTGFWPDYIVRLFRTGKATYPTTVHGQPMVVGGVDSFSAETELALLHNHYPDVTAFISRLNNYTTLEVEKLLSKKKVYTPLDSIGAFFSEFQTRFFFQEGYKDGMHGLSLSLLMGVYSMVSVLKAWEKTKTEDGLDLLDVEAAIVDGCSNTSYWVANEKLKTEMNMVRKLWYRLKRKMR